MTPPAEALSGRSVFVTGHTGFKGSWLTQWLHHLGARVTGYALAPPTEPSHFEVCRTRELLARHHEADVRDGDALSAAIDEAAPDVILHLAAQSLVRESYRNPVETFTTNIDGTVGVLDAVRRRGAPCVVIVVTSDKCYENQERDEPYTEDDPLGGHDPYSASKGAAEIVTASYRRSFFPPDRVAEHGIRVASARAGNVIGGGDWAPDRIVTDLVSALATGKTVPVRNPDAVRPWQHVLEPLSGYLALAAALLEADDGSLCTAWNFGPRPGDDITVGALVQLAVDTWGEGRWEHRVEPGAPHEAKLLRLDIGRAERRLGWRPRWSVQTAVRRTVGWYHAWSSDTAADMRRVSAADIETYEEAGVIAE